MRAVQAKVLLSALLFLLCNLIALGDAAAQACPAGRFCYYVPPAMTYGHSAGAWDLVLASSFGTVTGTYKIGNAAAVSFSITPATPLIVPLGETQGVVGAYSTPEQRGIFVQSSSDSLNVVHRRSSGNEQSSASIKDHTRALGQRFRVAGYSLNGLGGYETASYDIVSLYAPTGGTVTVSAPPGAPTPFWRGYTSNTINISLSAGETFLLRTRDSSSGGSSCAYDIDGALVTATRPIAVVTGGRGWASSSGIACSNNGGCGDDGVDNIFPTDYIGSEYVVSQYGTDASRRIVVVADSEGTEVRVNGALVATLNAGQKHAFQEAAGATYIQTSQPAYVYQNAALGASCELGFAFVPPVSFASSVINTAAFNVNGSATARILIETAKISGLRYDGNPLPSPTTIAVPGKPEWSIVSFVPGSGTHVVSSASDFQLGLVTNTGSSGLYAYYNIFNLAFCGDGNIDAGEGCDDGDRVNGDGCSAQCKIEIGTPGCVQDADCVTGGLCDAGGVCVACQTNAHCNDGNPCTTDVCNAGACTNTALTQGAACAGGVCNGSAAAPACVACVDTQPLLLQDLGCPVGSPACTTTGGVARCVGCLTDAQCADGNTCTTDSCTSGACAYAPVSVGASCDLNTGVCSGSAASPQCLPCIDSSPDGQDSGCTMALPYCDRSGATPVCVACIVDSQCAAGQLCNSASACVTAAIAISAPADNASFTSGAVTVSGTANAGELVTVQLVDDGGATVATLQVRANGGMWSAPFTGLPDGVYTARASILVSDGLLYADDISFTVDTQAPNVALTTPADGASTNDATPEISGVAVDATQVTIIIRDDSGATIATLTASPGPGGAWSISPTTPLADGDYTVTAQARDAAGNMSGVAGPNAFTVDTQAPSLAITAPTMGQVLRAGDVTVTGTSDPNQQVLVSLFDPMGGLIGQETVTADATGAWSADFTGLTDGVYRAMAAASDMAGGMTARDVTFAVDTQPLDLTVSSPADGLVTDDGALTIAGQATPDLSVEIIVRDDMGVEVARIVPTLDAQGNFSTTLATALGEGEYVVEVVASRQDGGSVSQERAVTVDTSAPDVAISQPGEGAVLGINTPTITGTAEPGATITVSVDGQPVGTATANMNGMWSLDLTTPLADGAHTVEATATDAAGNVSQPASLSFTVDTSAPPVTISAPMGGASLTDTTPTITGTAEPGATVTILIDGQVAGMATADANGVWTFDAPELALGAHTVEATVSDDLGNTGSSGEISFEIIEEMVTPTPAPVVITSPTDGGAVTGPSVTVTGTGEPGATVTVTIGDQTQTVVVGEDGSWSVTFDVVPAGEATIEAGDGASMTSVTVTVNEQPVDPQPEPDSDLIVVGGCAQGAPGAPAGASLWLIALGAMAVRRRRRA